MAYVEESRRPAVSRIVLDYLRIITRPVNDLFIVKNFSCHSKEGIYAALQVTKKMLRSDFTYVVNDTREAQLVIRCTNPADAERLDCRNIQFKFDDQIIKIYKLSTISPVPQGEDIHYEAPVRSYRARLEGRTELGYPVGYSGVLEDMEAHTNPYMSASTMSILGIVEGPVQHVMKCNVNYTLLPSDFLYAIRMVPCPGHYTFAVDQNGGLYFKFHHGHRDTELLEVAHFFLNRHMVKFYMVQSVRKRPYSDDKARRYPVYSRVSVHDHWEPV